MDGVSAQPVERSKGATIQVLLGPEEGMPHFYTRRFTLEPGARIPAHRHAHIEHEQVMLEGEMVLIIDGEERLAKAGDCIYIPSGVFHAYENRSPSLARFLCMVPATEAYETEWQD